MRFFLASVTSPLYTVNLDGGGEECDNFYSDRFYCRCSTNTTPNGPSLSPQLIRPTLRLLLKAFCDRKTSLCVQDILRKLQHLQSRLELPLSAIIVPNSADMMHSPTQQIYGRWFANLRVAVRTQRVIILQSVPNY